VEDWDWETIFCRHYRSIFNHCDIIGLQKSAKLSNSVKKCKIRAITPFKVTDVVTNQKLTCDFLLVINTN